MNAYRFTKKTLDAVQICLRLQEENETFLTMLWCLSKSLYLPVSIEQRCSGSRLLGWVLGMSFIQHLCINIRIDRFPNLYVWFWSDGSKSRGFGVLKLWITAAQTINVSLLTAIISILRYDNVQTYSKIY